VQEILPGAKNFAEEEGFLQVVAPQMTGIDLNMMKSLNFGVGTLISTRSTHTHNQNYHDVMYPS
jgi:hypothetical protein